MYTQPSSSTARRNFGNESTNTWLIWIPSRLLIVRVIRSAPPYVYAELILFVITCPLGAVNVTCSSRGIDIIEIVGLPGSMRTSSISLECGRTRPNGLFFGGGR